MNTTTVVHVHKKGIVDQMSDSASFADRSINDLKRYNSLDRVATIGENESVEAVDNLLWSGAKRVIVKGDDGAIKGIVSQKCVDDASFVTKRGHFVNGKRGSLKRENSTVGVSALFVPLRCSAAPCSPRT